MVASIWALTLAIAAITASAVVGAVTATGGVIFGAADFPALFVAVGNIGTSGPTSVVGRIDVLALGVAGPIYGLMLLAAVFAPRTHRSSDRPFRLGRLLAVVQTLLGLTGTFCSGWMMARSAQHLGATAMSESILFYGASALMCCMAAIAALKQP
jgi:membrane associated rhomboid family serine protease